MITGTELGAGPGQPLLDDSLQLTDTMPVVLDDVTADETGVEGPLALDYRAWGDQVESPRMAVPHDVTYEVTTTTTVNYDSKKYKYGVHTVTDK